MQHRAQTSLVVLDLPRLLGGDVLVDVADHAHRGDQRVLLVMLLDQRADLVERVRGLLEQRTVLVGHRVLVERRDLAEVLVDQVGDAIDQIAPARGQLLVVVAHELGPREVGVGGLRACDRDVVAHGVHGVASEDVLDVDDDAARRAELLALHRHELAGHHLLGQVQRAEFTGLSALGTLAVVGKHLGGPDLGVEGDVVLAHEVVGRALRVVPPFAPLLRVALAAGPFDGGRQVADHGVEPHVQLLVRVVDPALHRHRDTPVDVAGDGARLDFLEQAQREIDDVGTPALAGLQPRLVGFGERRQVEEVVLGLLEARGFAVNLGDGVDELVRVELVAAGVALVATRTFGMANRALALDVAVGQGTAGGRANRHLLGALVDVAVLQALLEHLLHHVLVVTGGGAGEQVVAQAEVAQILGDHAVVTVGQFLGSETFLLRLDENRGAVLVGAGHHQHVVALHTLISGVDVRGHAETGDMPDVTGAVRVRPSDIYQNMTHKSRLSGSAGTPRRIHSIIHNAASRNVSYAHIHRFRRVGGGPPHRMVMVGV